MKKSLFWFALLMVALVVVWSPEAALAAPGGKIVTGLFKSTWGKILLGILTILLLPLIAFIVVKERAAERRTLALLERIAATNPHFKWHALKERATECFHRVHAAWRQEDMSEASEWMTSWYWQNQQLAFLNQWERDGLVNHCRVKSLGKIRPLFVACEINEDGSADGSRLVISITANMEDYLAERATGRIVQGRKGFDSAEHVWTFVLQQGKWLVANIEEGSMSLTYAAMKPEVPEALRAEPSASPGTQPA